MKSAPRLRSGRTKWVSPDKETRSSRAKSRGVAALLQSTDRALRLNRAATLRAEAAERRSDTRGWVVQRRERTRHLIELGGLVQKAGLVELADDDRATLYGALLDLAGRARGDDAGDVLALWKRRGKRAFDAEAETTEAS